VLSRGVIPQYAGTANSSTSDESKSADPHPWSTLDRGVTARQSGIPATQLMGPAGLLFTAGSNPPRPRAPRRTRPYCSLRQHSSAIDRHALPATDATDAGSTIHRLVAARRGRPPLIEARNRERPSPPLRNARGGAAGRGLAGTKQGHATSCPPQRPTRTVISAAACCGRCTNGVKVGEIDGALSVAALRDDVRDVSWRDSEPAGDVRVVAEASPDASIADSRWRRGRAPTPGVPARAH